MVVPGGIYIALWHGQPIRATFILQKWTIEVNAFFYNLKQTSSTCAPLYVKK